MDSLELLKEAAGQLWINPERGRAEDILPTLDFTVDDIIDAERRLLRFAPLIKELFPETEAEEGIIESPLSEIPNMKKALGIKGKLLIKRDSELCVAGSVKARGGIYEVLYHTEKLLGDEVFKMSVGEIRNKLKGYTVQVGSTGNLGLSIGIMSAALGYRAVVHMSADAKEWKKALLREKGVTVVEYEDDYSAAVRQGREASDADPNSYFVDDENSRELFLGYAVAALRLKAQLDGMHVKVDAEHPLVVSLPCGVGGAPGGICFGLKHVFGDGVKCFFAEPVEAPCMLAAFVAGGPIPVTELGLSGKTEADGLAVGTASNLVYRNVNKLVSGGFTVHDSVLSHYQNLLYDKEKLFIEPSSAAAFGFETFAKSRVSESYPAYPDGPNVTHIVWATGGKLVPESERKKQLYTYVSAALLWRGGRFLTAKRPLSKARGGLWEFVGGKREEGETGEQALIRECREELSVDIEVFNARQSVIYRYPDITVWLTLYNAQIISGEPVPVEHAELKWILPEEIKNYEFCPADKPFLEGLDYPTETLRQHLFALKDEAYGAFQRKLIPNIDGETVIGVRVPKLREVAKRFTGSYCARVFMRELPHKYYEENMLHALFINEMKDFPTVIDEVERFLPYVDNWAVCDTLKPRVFKKHTDELLKRIPAYLESSHEYTVRFGLGMLMTYFLNEAFDKRVLELAYSVEREEYYIMMMQAWFFATAAAKHYDETIGYLEAGFKVSEVNGMTKRKCLESFRIPEDKKLYIKNLNILAIQ